MKILLLNCVYQEGSTGKIVAALSDELRAMGHEVLTCYGLGREHYDDYSEKVTTNIEHKFNAVLKRINGIPQGGIYLSNGRIERIIRRFHPDVVHIHSAYPTVFNMYRMLRYLSKAGIRTVFTLHAEITHTGGCEHAYDCNKWKEGCHHCPVYKQKTGSWFFDRSKASYRKMYDAINAFDTDKLMITAVSPWLADRARQSAIIRRYNVTYVPNGVDATVFHYKDNTCLIDRERYNKVILYVTAYMSVDETGNKGGRFIPLLSSALPDYKFIVVASRTDSTIDKLAPNVQLWGKAKSQEELAQLYSEADVTLLLSLRETFSMVTAESFCCGTPVIGFKAGGPESIALKEYCTFVDYGNIEGLTEALKSLETSYDKKSISAAGQSTYAKSTMASGYCKAYKEGI